MDNLAILKNILDENKFENRIKEFPLYDEDGTAKYLFFDFPIGREVDEIRIREDDPNIDKIINSDFLKYRGISNYEAIWSNELKSIECEIVVSRNNVPNRFVMRKLARFLKQVEDLEIESGREGSEPLNLTIYTDEQMSVSLGYSSREFAILSTYKEGRRLDFDRDIARFRLTLKIEGIAAKTQEDARKILEKVSNSVFYQFDILYDVVITLCPRRETRTERMKRAKKASTEVDRKDITLEYEYDEIPMSLYWFAQSSSYSPIFKYFALYQVLEYYFPIYSTMAAKTRIQNLIKDPKFNINRDSDVVKLLCIIKENSMNNMGSEREQLSITLRSIITGDDIIEFIESNENLNEYYKNKCAKNLSDKKLRLADNVGIVEDVAERIYEIRCRIVHNKASEIDNKILPMTKDVDYLVNDVTLLEFIARKVIVANSRQFSLT